MDVVLTDHAKEELKDHLPFSLVKKIVKNDKGIKFLDLESENLVYVYNKTSLVVDKKENKAVVVTGYRNEGKGRYGFSDRFKRIK